VKSKNNETTNETSVSAKDKQKVESITSETTDQTSTTHSIFCATVTPKLSKSKLNQNMKSNAFSTSSDRNRQIEIF
jgi:hypothetical protein